MKLQILEPCEEEWNQMLSVEDGRHCSHCDKVVVDFTKMSELEIENYFLELSNNKVCGRFKCEQLELSEQHYLINLKNKLSVRKPNPMILCSIFVLSLLIFLIGCEDKIVESPHILGEMIEIQDSTISEEKDLHSQENEN